MASMIPRNEGSFKPLLESARGIAALMVAVGHSLIVFPINGNGRIWEVSILDTSSKEELAVRIALLLGNGGIGVMFFFVLSGYLLAHIYSRKKQKSFSILSFYKKRIVRLYPCHVVVLTGICIVLSLTNNNLSIQCEECCGWKAMFNGWGREVKFSEYVLNALLISTNLNNLTWTLQLELVYAFLVPFVLFMVNKTVSHVIYIVHLFVILLCYFGVYNQIVVFVYFPFFYIGILFGVRYGKIHYIQTWIKKIPIIFFIGYIYISSLINQPVILGFKLYVDAFIVASLIQKFTTVRVIFF